MYIDLVPQVTVVSLCRFLVYPATSCSRNFFFIFLKFFSSKAVLICVDPRCLMNFLLSILSIREASQPFVSLMCPPCSASNIQYLEKTISLAAASISSIFGGTCFPQSSVKLQHFLSILPRISSLPHFLCVMVVAGGPAETRSLFR